MNHVYANAARAYNRASLTRSNLDTLVSLYDRMIVSLRQAQQSYGATCLDVEQGEVEKVIQALNGLRSSIDFRRGGDVAETLSSYYRRTVTQLLLRHRAPDRMAFYDSIIRQVSVMRNAWWQIATGETEKAEAEPEL